MNKLFGLFLVLMLLSACATSRWEQGRIKELPSEEIWQSFTNNQVQCTSLNGKARLQVLSPGEQQVSVEVVMQTDSFIGLSFRVLGIEGARVKITPDSVLIIDRIHKQYQPKSMAYFTETFGVPVNFSMLQNILLGRLVTDSGSWFPVVNDRYYQFNSSSDNWQQSCYLYPGLVLQQLDIEDPLTERKLHLQYADYKKIKGYPFSLSRQIEAWSVNKYAIELDWTSLSLNDPVYFEFKVNPKYEVVY